MDPCSFDVLIRSSGTNFSEVKRLTIGGIYGLGITVNDDNFVEWGDVVINDNGNIDPQTVASVKVTEEDFKCPRKVVCPVLRAVTERAEQQRQSVPSA